jgi:multiple antibiotic resistance protein
MKYYCYPQDHKMGMPVYLLIIFVILFSCLSFILITSPNVTYAEFGCIEIIDICKKNLTVRADTLKPFITFTGGAISKPIQILAGFLNEFGIETAKAVITLLVVIDPVGIIPLFASFTEKMNTKDRKSVSRTATITAGVLLFVFAMAGTQIFAILGIDVFSFMIAGGTLLFIISIELLTHGAWRFGGVTPGDDSGVVPLAFPLLAGPGAITSVIISYQTSGMIVTIVSIAIVIAITYVILLGVDPIYHVLGRRGSMVITRVFAVLVAAVAVQYIVEGIKQIYISVP